MKRKTKPSPYSPAGVAGTLTTQKTSATDTQPAALMAAATVADPSGTLHSVNLRREYSHALDSHANHVDIAQAVAIAAGFTDPAAVVERVDDETGVKVWSVVESLTPRSEARTFTLYRPVNPVRIVAWYGRLKEGGGLYAKQSCSLFIEHRGHLFGIVRPVYAGADGIKAKHKRKGWRLVELSTGAPAVSELGSTDKNEFLGRALNRLSRATADIAKAVSAWRASVGGFMPGKVSLNPSLPPRAFAIRTVERFADPLQAYEHANAYRRPPAPHAGNLTAAACAELIESGDNGGAIDQSGDRYIDRALLRASIMGHPNFACPISGVILDVARAVLIECADGSTVGPYDLPGVAKGYGKTPDDTAAALLAIARDRDPAARLLDGRRLFAS